MPISMPQNVVLFHNTPDKLETFTEYFSEKLSWLYPNTETHILTDESPLIIYDASLEPTPTVDTDSFFYLLTKTLELLYQDGYSEVGLSLLAQKLTSKFPYWKDQVGTSKLSE